MPVNAKFAFILEYVTDIEAATRFYTDQLGLTIDRQHPTFVQFKDAAGVNIAIASDEPLGNGEPEVYWVVDDVAAAYQAMSQAAEITLPLSDKPFGAVFGVKDPAGQTQYLVTFAESRPSQQVA